MKRYITILAAALVAMMTTSCLSEDPRDQLYEDDIYNSANNIYINAVAVLYNYIGGCADSEGLQGTCRGVYDYNTLTTDEAMIPIRGGDWYDGGLWENMYQHKWSPNDLPLYNTWKYLYKVVVLANKSLYIIDKYSHYLTEEQRVTYEAEVRAIRALFYYYIMDMYGRVPIVTSYEQPQDEVVQSERSEVFWFIVDELQEVAELLPNERSNKMGNYYGRVTRPVAHFLLAKLALNAEIYCDDNWTDGVPQNGKEIFFTVDGERLNAWQTCIKYCDKLAEVGYVLESDYSYNFAVHNENSNENIFTIPLDKNLYAAQFWYLFRSRHYNHGGALGGSSENGTSANISTVLAYGYGTDEEDARFEKNFYAGVVEVDGKPVMMDNGEPLEYFPLELKLNLTGSPYVKTAGARMAKYEVDRTSHSDGRQPDNDIVLFRYADAMLMKAEAKVRNGEDGSAELNEVRNRVGMPYREATLENILEERLLELVWEGWRRQDMVRFGLYHNSYDQRTQLPEEKSGYTTVFPIPQKSIDLNPRLHQNRGYK
ncbi:MAG: RagB/SusD family nutrient uptake outer membrane protein [Alistipes sp.]|nr:RagB/SusD family nutrient uptake outer membrane protein [Alistipes sp.]MBO7285963.1 RagB/SusD family nutrient uptake outer membrane protein [Alistipes sp.]